MHLQADFLFPEKQGFSPIGKIKLKKKLNEIGTENVRHMRAQANRQIYQMK